jgi:hypothetical protein
VRGTVTSEGREAVLRVEVLSAGGTSSLQVEAVVDTGFTGHLTLPSATVEALGLPIIGSAESILADGSLVMSDRYGFSWPTRRPSWAWRFCVAANSVSNAWVVGRLALRS